MYMHTYWDGSWWPLTVPLPLPLPLPPPLPLPLPLPLALPLPLPLPLPPVGVVDRLVSNPAGGESNPAGGLVSIASSSSSDSLCIKKYNGHV